MGCTEFYDADDERGPILHERALQIHEGMGTIWQACLTNYIGWGEILCVSLGWINFEISIALPCTFCLALESDGSIYLERRNIIWSAFTKNP